MADFSSSAFGGTGPDPAISPSIGGIAKNLTSTLFGNPDDYAKNAYYGAETRKTNQQTQDMVDASTAAKGLATTFSDPSFFSKPPPGVDPGQWVAQHLSAAAKNAFLSAYAKDPGAAMQNVQRLASMTSIMTGDQGMGLTGLAIEGHAPTDQTALTPDAQAQIYGRTAKAALDRAGVAANAEVTSREYAADQDTASKKYAVDNPHFVLPAGSTGIVGSNATNLYNDQNKGVFQAQPSESSAKGAAFAALTPAQQTATFFQPHNVEPGAATIIPSGSPYADPNATTVIPAPKTAAAQHMPKLGGADNIELQSDIVHSFDPGDNSGIGKEAQAAKFGAVTANLTPDELAEMNDVIAKEYAASNNLQSAGAAGAAYLKSKLQIASMLQRVVPGSSRYSRITAAPAAQQPAASTAATPRVAHLDPATGNVWTPTPDGGWSVTPGGRAK